METSLMVDDYPTAPEEDTEMIEVTITVTFNSKIEVPKDWDQGEIEEDVKDNLWDIINPEDVEEIEVDV